MSVDDPKVIVHCDKEGCFYSEFYELTAIAYNSFDLRDLEAELESTGWELKDDRHICETCIEAEALERYEADYKAQHDQNEEVT